MIYLCKHSNYFPSPTEYNSKCFYESMVLHVLAFGCACKCNSYCPTLACRYISYLLRLKHTMHLFPQPKMVLYLPSTWFIPIFYLNLYLNGSFSESPYLTHLSRNSAPPSTIILCLLVMHYFFFRVHITSWQITHFFLYIVYVFSSRMLTS